MASRTTMPSDTSAVYSTNLPPFASPRQTRNVACCIFNDLLHFLNNLFQLSRHFRDRLALQLHGSIFSLENDNIDLAELRVLLRQVLAKMSAPAFFSF